MQLFYKHSLLSEALKPGWPRESAGRALGLWIGWLGGGELLPLGNFGFKLLAGANLGSFVDDLTAETALESDERFFVLKPYVFGAHKVMLP